jgi:hypothetical protein
MSNKFIKFHGVQLAENAFVKNMRIEQLASDPTPVAAGRLWYNTTSKVFKFSSLDANDAVVVRQTVSLQEMTAAIATETAARTAADAAIHTEMDSIETSVGLNLDGTFAAHVNTNYIDASAGGTSVKAVDALLDAQIKAVSDLVTTESGNRQTQDEATRTGAGLVTSDGSYDAHSSADYISSATSLSDADLKLSVALKAANDALTLEASTRASSDAANQTAISNTNSELTTTQAAAGLATDGSFISHTTTNYINGASSLQGADVLLDAQIKTVADSVSGSISGGIASLEAEVNAIEVATGLEANGTYVEHTTTNYINGSQGGSSLKAVDVLLDAKLKVVADDLDTEEALRASQVTALQTELDSTQTGSGLSSAGQYVPNGSAPIISGASSLVSADELLASTLNSVDVELTTTQAAAGLGTDGAFVAHTSTNYIDNSLTMFEVDTDLDAAIKTSYDLADAAVAKSGDTMSGVLNMDTNRITNLSAPVADGDAANKAYVDAVSEGLHVHEQAQVVLTGTLESISGGVVTYSNGSVGVGATLTMANVLNLATDLDGHSVSIGERIIVNGQANLAHNGIYDVTSTTVLTRSSDFDTPAEMAGGDFIFVTSGNQYADTGWVLGEPVATVGTTDVHFIQFSGAGQILAGAGIKKDGNELFLAFGAGVVELPSDEIGLDLASDSGLMLSQDGSTPSIHTDATLQLKLDGGTMSKSASGVRVSASVMAQIAAVESDAVAIQSELDSTQAAAGLTTSGGYDSDQTSNYIQSAGTLYQADQLLDAQIKVASDAIAQEVIDRTAADSAINSELTVTQTGAGLLATGAYDPHTSADYIDDATSLHNADLQLSQQIKVNTDAIATLESDVAANVGVEIDAIELAAGLETDGTYVAHTTTNYINGAQGGSSLKAVDVLLDAAIKASQDQLESEIGDVESDLATEQAARIAGDSAIRTAVNSTKFVYQSTATALTHEVQHNLSSDYLIVQVMVLGDDGLYANDLVPVEQTTSNKVTCYLTESSHVRVSVMSMSDI